MQNGWITAVWCMLIGATLSVASAAGAEQAKLREDETLRTGTRLSGLGAGISLGTRQYGGGVAHDMAVFQVHHGVIVSGLLEPAFLPNGRVILAGDFLFARQYRPNTAVLFGASPLLRYAVDTGGRWMPFVEAGSGFAFTDIGGPSLSGKLQFSPQAGAGLYWFVTPELAVKAQHRFVHYSNASLRSPNVGINQHIFLLGLTRFY